MADTLNTPYTILKPFAENGDRNDIPETVDPELGLMSQDVGFPPITSKPIYEGGVAPNRRDFNGAFNILAQHNFFMQNGGTYTFNQDLSDFIGGYPAGVILSYKPTTGSPYLVQSLIDNNTNNFVSNPALIDGVHWKKINATAEELENYVKLTGNQSIDGIKTFTGSISLNSNQGYIMKCSNIENGVIPSQNVYIESLFIADKNGDFFGYVGPAYTASGRYSNRLGLLNQTTGSVPTIEVGVNADGTDFTSAPNPPSASNDTSIATTSWVRSNVGGGIPVGTILPYGGTTAPTGFLLCNGGAISRTTYANLFSVIGTAYGAGDGNTTFNLPNGTNRYIGYMGQGYLTENLPNITGTFSASNNTSLRAVISTGAFTSIPQYNDSKGSTGHNMQNFIFTFNASSYNNKYTSTNEVRPLTTRANMIIKY